MSSFVVSDRDDDFVAVTACIIIIRLFIIANTRQGDFWDMSIQRETAELSSRTSFASGC